MRYDDHQAGEAANALEKDLKCGGTGCADFDRVNVNVTDRATSTNRDRTLHGRWTGRCVGWVGDARASLRGRRLFTLFAVVNLVNYLDRGVRVDGCRMISRVCLQ